MKTLRLVDIFNPNSVRARNFGRYLGIGCGIGRGARACYWTTDRLLMTSGNPGWKLAQDHGGLKLLVAMPTEKRLAEDVKGWTV